MSFVIGATGKRDESERGKAEEYQIFHHVSIVKVGAAEAHNSSMHTS
jgi:hypothetical protein